MKTFKLLGMLIITISASLAVAQRNGYGMGNGGDVIVCKNGHTTQVEVLDVYEARTNRLLVLDLGPQNLSWEEKVEIALKRLDHLDKLRADRYRRWAASFLNESRFLENINLEDINDSLHLVIPIGCKIEQIAIQKKPLFKEDPYYFFDKYLWDQLDNDNKAVIVLHEIIYREALEFGHENSISVRYFNSIIFSNLLEKMSYFDYMDLLYKLPFGSITLNGIDIALFSVTLGRINVYSHTSHEHFFKNGKFPNETQIYNQSTYKLTNNTFVIKERSYIRFHPNGTVAELAIAHQQKIYISNTEVLVDNGSTVRFYPDGKLHLITNVIDGSLEVDGAIQNNIHGNIYFNEDGSILNFKRRTNGGPISSMY